MKSSFQNKLMKIGSRSDMMLRGNPWSLHIVSMNNVATMKAVNCVGRAPKWKPLENLSTTTMIVVNPWELGRWVTKSMERSSQTLTSIGIDCNKPALLRVMCLICWHTAHSRTKVLMSLIMLCHWKLD